MHLSALAFLLITSLILLAIQASFSFAFLFPIVLNLPTLSQVKFTVLQFLMTITHLLLSFNKLYRMHHFLSLIL